MWIKSIWVEQKRYQMFKLAWRLNFAGKYMEINRVRYHEAIDVADFAISTSKFWSDSKPFEYAEWLSKPANFNKSQFEDWKNEQTIQN